MANETLSNPSYLDETKKPVEIAKVEERKPAKPVAEGKVTVKKKSTAKRLRESLGLEETRTVGDYLVWDVLVPAAKELVADLVKKGVEVFLFGGAQPNRQKGNISRVSYDGYYGSSRKKVNDYKSDVASNRYANRYGEDFTRFVFDDKRTADIVLSELCEIIDVYGFARVSDFYSAVGESERNYVDRGFGWDALGMVEPERVRDGWIIDMPRPIPLN